MEQAFLLPLPKYNGPRQVALEEEREQLRARWRESVCRLQRDRSLWPRILEALAAEPPAQDHPLLGVFTEKGQSLLHLAVLDDQLDCISLLRREKTLMNQRNEYGLTPLELALFLHKKKSASLLSSASPAVAFVAQPRVEFEDPERIAQLSLEYLPHPIFESNQVLEEILSHTLRAKHEDAIPHDRIWMGIYYDSEIQQAIHPKMSVQWIDEEIGFGVFCRERILPCNFVGEYTGLIQERKPKHARESEYCFRFTSWTMGRKHYVADAERLGNFTRFLNHSDRPNVVLVCAYWRGLPRLIFISLREIVEGEQLLFDYGRTFWQQSPQRIKRSL